MLVSYRGFESFPLMAGFEDAALAAIPRATSNCCGVFSCLPSFFGGILVVAFLEIVYVAYFVNRLLTRKARHPSSTSSLEYGNEEVGSISFSLQGNLWVAPLPEGDWKKAVLQKPGKDKKKEKEAEKDGSKEGSKRVESNKDVIEIAPVWKHVTLKEGNLVLKGADGIEEHISLEGCQVVSVSAGTSEGGKWAKRYPIKLHHSSRTLYRDCKDCLFYTESGFEKEAWCEVLRGAAREKSGNDWCTRLKKEFREYTDGAEKHVPYLSKFYLASEVNHFIATRSEEENPSKARLFLNKLLRRNSKGKNSKENTRSPNAEEERNSKGKNSKENTRSPNAEEEYTNFTRRQSQAHNEGSSRKGKEDAVSDDPEGSKSGSHSSHVSNDRISRSESASSDSDGEKSALATTQKDRKESDEVLPAALMHGSDKERIEKEIDQGLLCLNMLVGRLFFDFYHSDTRVGWVQKHFQRLISKIKTPSYIKSITIKELDLGKDPPFATALRMLPADSAGALALEVDMEWHGGGFITIETRVDVRDQIAQEKVTSQTAEPGAAQAAAVAIVSGIEDTETAEASPAVTEGRQATVSKKTKSGDDSSRMGGWINSVKYMVSRVADQVSQVPLLLKIRLVSVKGTCRICLRAPPSDRIWFSFKEMPNIDLAPEPGIGDHRFSSGPLGSFIANQIKVQIRESIVTPYSQDLFLHWMAAEKDDWIPQSEVPVAFSALQISESERQVSKPNPGVQSNTVEENGKSGQLLSSRNGQSKPQISESPSESVGHGSPDSLPPQTPSSPYGPVTQMPPPSSPLSQSSLSTSGTTRNHSRFAANSEQSSLEHSFPSRPSAPPSIREDNESDLTTPLLDDDDYSRNKPLDTSSEFDAGSSDMETARPLDKDLLQLSEGSASQIESQNPSHQLQVGNQEHPKADLSKDSDSSASSRRSKVISFGRKGFTKLEEKRRIALERLREKRGEAPESGGSSRHSRHFSSG